MVLSHEGSASQLWPVLLGRTLAQGCQMISSPRPRNQKYKFLFKSWYFQLLETNLKTKNPKLRRTSPLKMMEYTKVYLGPRSR